MITIKYPFAEFDYDQFHGELLFELQPTDDGFDVTINQLVAFTNHLEIELEYILTDDEQMELLLDLFNEAANCNLYEELKQSEQDYHDDQKYECWKHEK